MFGLFEKKEPPKRFPPVPDWQPSICQPLDRIAERNNAKGARVELKCLTLHSSRPAQKAARAAEFVRSAS